MQVEVYQEALNAYIAASDAFSATSGQSPEVRAAAHRRMANAAIRVAEGIRIQAEATAQADRHALANSRRRAWQDGI